MTDGPGARRSDVVADARTKVCSGGDAITGSASVGCSSVVVTRHRHPLEGQTLVVLGRMRRHGALELLVVLPDGSKTLLPATWSDLGATGAAGDVTDSPATVTLGSLGDLLAASALMAALAVRSRGAEAQQAARRPPRKEDDRATCPVEFDARGGAAASAGPRRVGAAGPARRRDRGAGPPDRQGELDNQGERQP